MAKLSRRAAAIRAAAETAYGPRGLTQLAAAAKVSKQMLSFVVRDEKAASDGIYRKVAEALLKEAGRMQKAAGKVETMAQRMLRELESAKGG